MTGASRGIGAATAIELARRGAHVVITARTQGGLEETDDAIRAIGGAATLLPLDLMNGAHWMRSVRACSTAFAAWTSWSPTPEPRRAHARAAYPSRRLGRGRGGERSPPWRLIRTCGPLLRQAPAGRAVFVTEARARAPNAYWGAIGATKAAMEHLVLTWADEVATTRCG